jgi:thiosulfate reductase cytochrome b subunit
MEKIRPKHPLWLRCSHWLNLPLFLLMVWSGLLIYWANDIYAPFFPQWFYDALDIPQRLAEGMAIHFAFAWAFTLNGLFWLAGSVISNHWREIAPSRQAARNLLPTIAQDLHLKSGPAPAQGKFNAAQRFAYSGVFLLAALEVFTGFLVYKPVQLGAFLPIFGGYEGARFVHFVLMLFLLAFTALHILQVARAGWNNFRAMVAGYEVEK